MAFNEKLPKWDNVGVEPPESKKTEGWQPTEKPPAQWFNWIFNRIYKVVQELQNKAVEKETGKGLSTNDYTTTEKNKLAGIATGANKTIINNTLTSTSTTEALSANQGKNLKDSLDEHKAENVSYYVGVTRDASLTGEQIISGFPFVPKALIIDSVVINSRKVSYGKLAQNSGYCLYQREDTSNILMTTSNLINIAESSSAITRAVVTINPNKTITLNWNHLDGGATGDISVRILALSHGHGGV